MRDYITEVNDTPIFRTALLAEVEAGSPYCYLTEEGDAKLTFCKVPVLGLGDKSVSVCRLSDEEITWFLSLPCTVLLGEALTDYITEYSDVAWCEGGEAEYFAVNPASRVIQGVLASSGAAPLITEEVVL